MTLRVPEDISLMSFDKPLVESQRPDFFTHISQSEYLMGKEASTILKHQIETRDPQVTHRVMSPLLEVHKSHKGDCAVAFPSLLTHQQIYVMLSGRLGKSIGHAAQWACGMEVTNHMNQIQIITDAGSGYRRLLPHRPDRPSDDHPFWR